MKKLLLFIFLSYACHSHAQQLVIPAGHTAATSQGAFSNDSRYIATASDDNTAKLWDAASGKLLFTFYGHKNLTGDISFSNDNKYLVTHSGKDSVSFIWNTKTGQLVMSFDSISNYQNDIPLISNDGKLAFTGGKTGINVWNISSGVLVKTLDYGNYYRGDSRGKIICAPDNSGIIIPEQYGYLCYWDLATGKLKSVLDTGPDYWVKIFFTAGNKKLVLISDSRVSTFDLATGNLLSVKNHLKESGKLKTYTYKTFISADNRFILKPCYYVRYEIRGNDTIGVEKDIFKPAVIDVQSDKVSFIPSDYIGPFDEINVSDDLSHIVLTTDSAYYFLEKQTGRYVLKGKAEKMYGDLFHWINMRKDGKVVAAKGPRGIVNIYNPQGSILNRLTGDIELERKAAFSENGKYIISKDFTRWDISKGRAEHSYQSPGKTVAEDERLQLLAYYGEDDSYENRRWKAVYKNDTVILKDYHSYQLSGNIIPSTGKIMTYNGSDSVVNIWNTDGSLFYTLPVAANETPVFSPAGDKVVLLLDYWNGNLDRMWDHLQKVLDGEDEPVDTSRPEGYLVQVVDLNSGSILLRMRDAGDMQATPIITFSNRSDHLIICGDKYSWLFNTRTWQKTVLPLGCYQAKIAFDSAGERILISRGNKTILFHVPSLKVLYTLPGSTNYSNFSEDGKLVLTASADKSMRVWDAANGNLRYTYLPFTNEEYLVTDEQGHFDGSETARKKLYFNCNNELIDLLQVKDQLWVPNLAERIMKKEPINAPKLSELNICGLTPVIRDLGADDKSYHFHITPRKGGLGETVVYVNNIEVKKYQPADLIKDKEGYTLHVARSLLQPLFVNGSDNEVSLKAFASGNQVASRGVSIQQKATAKNMEPPNLYAVMVGVSDYKGEELDLKYAAKDAADLSAAIKLSAGKLLNTDGKEHVFMYNLVTSGDHYLLPEKNGIKQTLAEIGTRSKPNDILLLFFAGHGVMEGVKKQFFFLTADASKNADVTATGISTAELTEWMKPANIKAQKRILILDACNSGQAINDIVHIGKDDDGYVASRNDDNSQQVKAIDKLNERSGMFILSASAGNQSAYELSRYSQGLLTYALLKVMKEQPSVLEDDRYLDIGKWFHEAANKVSELAGSTGNRQDPKISATNSFNIGIVDTGVIAAINIAQEKSLFAASNFQNNDETVSDDDLGLSDMVNNALFMVSARSAETKISYITVTHSPDAYTLSGRYEIKNDMVTVRVNLKQHKTIIQRFEVTGKKDQLENIAAEVVRKAAEFLP
jgi:WD40 repeat protein/uncharacterized caspase-like protein